MDYDYDYNYEYEYPDFSFGDASELDEDYADSFWNLDDDYERERESEDYNDLAYRHYA